MPHKTKITLENPNYKNFFDLMKSITNEEQIKLITKNCHYFNDTINPIYKATSILGRRKEEQDALTIIDNFSIPEKKREKFFVDYFANLREFFKNFDKKNAPENLANFQGGGSTATVPYLSKSDKSITTYNVGDSEVYVLVKYNGETKTVRLTQNHDADNKKAIANLPDDVGIEAEPEGDTKDQYICRFSKPEPEFDDHKYIRCKLVDAEGEDEEYVNGEDGKPLKNGQKYYCKDDDGQYFVKDRSGKFLLDLDKKTPVNNENLPPDGFGIKVMQDGKTESMAYEFNDIVYYTRCKLVDAEGDNKDCVNGEDGKPLKNKQNQYYRKDNDGKYYVKDKDGTFLDDSELLNVFNTIGDENLTNTWVDSNKFTLEDIVKTMFGPEANAEECEFGVISCCDGVSEGAKGYCCDYIVDENGKFQAILNEEKDPQRNISHLKTIFDTNGQLQNLFNFSFTEYLVMSAFYGSDLQNETSQNDDIELEFDGNKQKRQVTLSYRGVDIGYTTKDKNNNLDKTVCRDTDTLFAMHDCKSVDKKGYDGKASFDNIISLYHQFTLKTLNDTILAVFDGHGEGGELVSEVAAKYLQARVQLYYGNLLPRITDYDSYKEASEGDIQKQQIYLYQLLLYGNEEERSYAANVFLYKANFVNQEVFKTQAVKHLLSVDKMTAEDAMALIDKIEIHDESHKEHERQKLYKYNLASALWGHLKNSQSKDDYDLKIKTLLTMIEYASTLNNKIVVAKNLRKLILGKFDIVEKKYYETTCESLDSKKLDDSTREQLIQAAVLAIKDTKYETNVNSADFLLTLIDESKPEYKETYAKERILALKKLIKYTDDNTIKIVAAKKLLVVGNNNDWESALKELTDSATRILADASCSQNDRNLAITELIKCGSLPSIRLNEVRGEDYKCIKTNIDALLSSIKNMANNEAMFKEKKYKRFFVELVLVLEKLSDTEEAATKKAVTENPGVKQIVAQSNSKIYRSTADAILEKIKDPKYKTREWGEEMAIPNEWIKITSQPSNITRYPTGANFSTKRTRT